MKFTLSLLAFLLLISCGKEAKKNSAEEASQYLENHLYREYHLASEGVQPDTLLNEMQKHHVVGTSIAVLHDGKIQWAKGYGLANDQAPVDSTTLFQAASISKPIAALAVLKLLEDGKVSLDSNVNTYLKTWKLPGNKFTHDKKVTLRQLLSHTAGTNVHGFPGYTEKDSMPTGIEVLEGKGNTDAVVLDTVPGTRYRYSGGGYTIVQQVIEDVSGMTFETYMQQHILEPLGMHRSTYAQPLPANREAEASAAFDGQGNKINNGWHHYPEQAAAGLWTTPSDLLRYVQEIQAIRAGKTNGLLQPETVNMMLAENEHMHGLGPSLEKIGDTLIFSHGGKNAGYTNVFMGFADQGKGLAVLTNSDKGGRILSAISRGVSDYYNWGIYKPQLLDTISLPDSFLEQFTGNYTYVSQVPGAGGDYNMSVQLREGQLHILDIPESTTYSFVATDSLHFRDLQKNARIHFDEGPVLWWNGRFEFRRR
ncbi:serine hydrolase [Zeaxanthinibacter sp. PT1]|uniref:serine hydrolase domain-containing protein n=1 Tax=Zeaxanthinibacter TaxID=561554 RepID=UPI00234A3593|nr:serine hydrolase domain-containing protein [Zeaxanthinibacter sp. PT1]MDC6350458.1 serine hydrolase [Zeaxanthinibacter sp. PT1]